MDPFIGLLFSALLEISVRLRGIELFSEQPQANKKVYLLRRAMRQNRFSRSRPLEDYCCTATVKVRATT